MSLFCRLTRKHYWCTPHRAEDYRLVQVCYECGAERPARELHEDALLEPNSQTARLTFGDPARKAVPRVIDQPAISTSQRKERLIVGESSRRFVLVK